MMLDTQHLVHSKQFYRPPLTLDKHDRKLIHAKNLHFRMETTRVQRPSRKLILEACSADAQTGFSAEIGAYLKNIHQSITKLIIRNSLTVAEASNFHLFQAGSHSWTWKEISTEQGRCPTRPDIVASLR